ncbi:MAG: hypothetical protein ACE5IL_12545 [Myxococcota bacterium]
MTFARARARLARAGFGVSAALPVDVYDTCVPDPWRAERVRPGTRSVWVIASAGRTLWSRFRDSPEFALEDDPLDRYSARVVREAAGRCEPSAGTALYFEQRGGRYLPLVELAERAGVGRSGRMGLLLHPVYGPWISIRALLYVTDATAPRSPDPFAPCAGCPAPCASACHGDAIGPCSIDVERCYAARLKRAPCREACDARSACVIGQEHAFSREQIAHHSRIREARRR